MEELAQFVKKCDPSKARKKTRNKKAWKREVERQERYQRKELPSFPNCGHNKKAFRCANVSCQDIRRFNANFYKCSTKILQDHFILRYCNVKESKKKTSGSKRNVSIKYHIQNKQGTLVPVCQKTFLKALTIKKDRVQGVMNRFYSSNGSPPKERRGGDRKSEIFEAKKTSVQWFIEKFKANESHYCRSQTNRQYLPADLNIKKMWRMYNAERDVDLKVKQSYFRNIFNTYYNLGFGSPRTDVCSTCISLQEQIKAENNTTKKNELMVEKRIHRLKYKAFYSILKEENENLKTISFDCQKNQALPKLPDQSAYFSRQFSFYNFTIVEGSSKAKLTKETVFSYYWNDTTHLKGSNEIVSAVYHYLKNSTIAENVKILRIVCDGRSSQNKNTAMIAMLGKWLCSEAPRINVKKIELIFPVVGHSFIPPDRVFAKIERIIKKKEAISSPEEYISIVKDNTTAFDLASVPVYDWKTAYQPIIKPTTSWHIEFQKTKRFFLTCTKTENILVQGEVTYKSEVRDKKVITKKNMKITMISPLTKGPNQIVPNLKKTQDVIALLTKHYGSEWRNNPYLLFYKNIEDKLNAEPGSNLSDHDDEDACDLCESNFVDDDKHV